MGKEEIRFSAGPDKPLETFHVDQESARAQMRNFRGAALTAALAELEKGNKTSLETLKGGVASLMAREADSLLPEDRRWAQQFLADYKG